MILQAALRSTTEFAILDLPAILMEEVSKEGSVDIAFGETFLEKLFLSIGLLLRFCLTILLFFMLCAAERTFKERFVRCLFPL